MTLVLWGTSLFAQNYLDVLRPHRGMRGVPGADAGVLPAALEAAPGLTGNPAVLSYQNTAFLSADLSLDQVAG